LQASKNAAYPNDYAPNESRYSQEVELKKPSVQKSSKEEALDPLNNGKNMYAL
jgi:hypothetical protein